MWNKTMRGTPNAPLIDKEVQLYVAIIWGSRALNCCRATFNGALSDL